MIQYLVILLETRLCRSATTAMGTKNAGSCLQTL